MVVPSSAIAITLFTFVPTLIVALSNKRYVVVSTSGVAVISILDKPSGTSNEYSVISLLYVGSSSNVVSPFLAVILERYAFEFFSLVMITVYSSVILVFSAVVFIVNLFSPVCNSFSPAPVTVVVLTSASAVINTLVTSFGTVTL